MGCLPPRRVCRTSIPAGAAGGDGPGDEAHLHRGQQRRLPVRVRRRAGGVRRRVRPALHRAGTGWRSDSPTGATSSATTSPSRTCVSSRPWCASIPVYHGHFKCNRAKLIEFPALWAYARDLFQTPGFGDTVDFEHIKTALLRGALRHQSHGHRAEGPGLGELAEPARSRSVGRQRVRRRHGSRTDRRARAGGPRARPGNQPLARRVGRSLGIRPTFAATRPRS